MGKSFLLFFCITCCLFSKDYEIVVEPSNLDVCDMIVNGLEDFNIEFFKKKHELLELEPFVIYAQDEGCNIIGGLFGGMIHTSSGAWALIEYAWVDKNRRHQGIGTELFKRAEVLIRAKNCEYVQLFTWEYQAVGFYEKLGFQCVGVIPKWIEQYDAVFFRKKLSRD